MILKLTNTCLFNKNSLVYGWCYKKYKRLYVPSLQTSIHILYIETCQKWIFSWFLFSLCMYILKFHVAHNPLFILLRLIQSASLRRVPFGIAHSITDGSEIKVPERLHMEGKKLFCCIFNMPSSINEGRDSFNILEIRLEHLPFLKKDSVSR